ncbi:MAG TPA: cupin domain-containing protein [Planctomycetia bacterium]|nr:cupin domain-containing protein [Planctomycetia bacterium]
MPAAFHRPAGVGRTYSIVGDVYRFLATGGETGGRYAQFEALVPPGGGPPPHIHSRETECFFVVEGEIDFHAEGKRFVAGPGSFVHAPSGSPHSFRNESDAPARMIITIAPAGLEEMFFRCGAPLPEGATAAAPPTPAEIEKLLALAPEYGVEILPPPT